MPDLKRNLSAIQLDLSKYDFQLTGVVKNMLLINCFNLPGQPIVCKLHFN